MYYMFSLKLLLDLYYYDYGICYVFGNCLRDNINEIHIKVESWFSDLNNTLSCYNIRKLRHQMDRKHHTF